MGYIYTNCSIYQLDGGPLQLSDGTVVKVVKSSGRSHLLAIRAPAVAGETGAKLLVKEGESFTVGSQLYSWRMVQHEQAAGHLTGEERRIGGCGIEQADSLERAAANRTDLSPLRTLRRRNRVLKVPRKLPRVKVERDGGISSYRTRLHLRQPCVNVRPDLRGWWDKQLTIIDTHYAGNVEAIKQEPCPCSSVA